MITLVCADGVCDGQEEQTIEIPYSAKVDCLGSDKNCEAKGPECVVDFNNEYYVQFSNPSYKESVRSTLASVISKHYAGYKEYSLPIDVLWGLAGVGDLFDPINTGCCACDADQCVPEINFTTDFKFPNTARFTWNSADGSPLVKKSIPNPLYKSTISIPAQVSGWAVVGGGFVELFYSSEKYAPNVELEYIGPDGDYKSNTVLYSNPMLCTGTGMRQTTVRHPRPSQVVPNIHLRAAESAAIQ